MKNRDVVADLNEISYDLPKSEESEEELLMQAIKKLDKSERAFILLYLEDKSYKEMAEILGLSESNIGVKLNRIKKKLKTLIVV